MINDKVLIIEDEINIANSIETILGYNNIKSDLADCGLKAIDLLKTNKYSCILCDINLPDINGYEILDIVRHQIKSIKIPFIFLTAFADAIDIRKGMNSGADDYITKPFTASNLLETIRARIIIKQHTSTLINEEVNNQWVNVVLENLNHELLTPLNGIITSIDVLQSIHVEKTSIDKFREVMSILSTSGKRMHKNIKKLILYSLLMSMNNEYKKSLEYAELNLSELLHRILKNSSEKCGEMFNYAHIEIEDNLKILGVKNIINTIFEELIDNSFKFCVDGYPTIKLYSYESHIIFSVENNSKVTFEYKNIQAFKKFHSDKTKNGMGIGLYLCKELTLMQNYKMDVLANENTVNIKVQF
jgi:DNA-binding response OmpR family regulator